MKRQKKENKKAKAAQRIDHKQMQRIALIHEMIKAEKYPSREDLINAFKNELRLDNVSIRTCQRDIDVLRDGFGAAILYSRRLNGYYYATLQTFFNIRFPNLSLNWQRFFRF